jgi:integrase
VYEHQLILPDNLLYSRSFIVLKNYYDVIVHFTCFHKYVGVYENSICRPLTADAKTKMHYVCSMLNYILIDNYETFRSDHVYQVSKEMLDCFFRDFASEKLSNGSYRGRQSIEKCVHAVTEFFTKLIKNCGGYMALKKEQLYVEKTVFTMRGQMQKKFVPNFQVSVMPKHKKIFRDIPTKVFQILINQAFLHAQDIVFAICIQAFAGLRPGEACNVRQESSPLGSGVILTMVGATLKRAEIDITAEYALRSDGIVCGRIKKERRQRVHPAFLSAFSKAYAFHKEFLKTQSYEPEYCPMFVNSKGMAMTYDDYQERFKNLITKYVRPLLLNHEDPECRLYGQLLYEHSLGPHALRHWFSVQLVLMGEDIAQIQYWRGDTSPESALSYLQNKGDLVKELSAANEFLAGVMMKEGNKLYGKMATSGK